MKYRALQAVLSLWISATGGVALGVPARTLMLSEADVGHVNTAPGYSTILQFDARPTSVISGDQDAFRIEYVGNSLTIKPLTRGARTNLFVFTDYERFSFRLISGKSEVADYVVKVRRPSQTPSQTVRGLGVPRSVPPGNFSQHAGNVMVDVPMRGKASCGGISITISSVSYPHESPWIQIAFSISRDARSGTLPIEFKPEDLAVLKSEERLSVETLHIESLSLSSEGMPIHGMMLLQQKYTPSLALAVQFSPAALTILKCRPLKVRLPRATRPKGVKGERREGKDK